MRAHIHGHYRVEAAEIVSRSSYATVNIETARMCLFIPREMIGGVVAPNNKKNKNQKSGKEPIAFLNKSIFVEIWYIILLYRCIIMPSICGKVK